MHAKKSLGQNFLMHAQTASRIVHVSDIPAEGTVLEIGPGTGMLTKELLKVCNRVIAVEADFSLRETLQQTFEKELEEGRLTLIFQDIRQFDTTSIKQPYVLVANIPYYITGEIIRMFLTAPHAPVRMTLLVQKEVAVRVARSSKESLLSLSVKIFGTPHYRFTVPSGAFIPRPKVDSAVLSITDIRNPFKDRDEEALFFELLHAGFAHKRKLLRGNLESLYTKEKIVGAFEALSLPLSVRAENLSCANWIALFEKLS